MSEIGFERKIGYSFVGLMAGNAASTVGLLLIAVLPSLDALTEVRKVWNLSSEQAASASVLFLMFSMLAWVVVGLPIVLLLRAEIAADFYWITAALIGAVIGSAALLLMFSVLNSLNGGHADPAILLEPSTLRLCYVAALIAGVAFAVYCLLVKRALGRQAKESGAPSGTPRSLAWFDF